MALRNILNENDFALRKVCKPVVNFDNKLYQLLGDMWETLKSADGVGLAANQIGILKNIFIVYNRTDKMEFINPILVSYEGEQEGEEGCLSCPGVYGKVKRPQKISVSAQNRKGGAFALTLEDMNARIFCHENDHLYGKIFKDIAYDFQL